MKPAAPITCLLRQSRALKTMILWRAEGVTWMHSVKKGFWKGLQYKQEYVCTVVSFEVAGLQHVTLLRKTYSQSVSQKIKTYVFPKLGIRLEFTKSPHHGQQQICFVTTKRREHWKMPFWEINISEHDIVQHTNHHWKIFFSLFIINLFGIWTRNK